MNNSAPSTLLPSNTILSSFESILREIKSDDSYCMDPPDNLRKELQILSTHFLITPRQALLLTAVIDLCGFGTVECSKLAEALRCNFFSFLSLKSDIDALRNRELIEGTQILSIPQDLIDSIADNRPYSASNLSDMSTERILGKLASFHRLVIEKRKTPVAFLRAADIMVLENQSTSLAMASDRYGVICYDSVRLGISDDEKYSYAMEKDERMLYYCLLARIDEKLSWYELSPFLSPNGIKEMQRKVRAGELRLQSEGVVEYVCDSSSEEYLFIPDKVKEQILSDVGGMRKKVYFPEVVRFQTIQNRDLFYPQPISERITELSNLLSDDSFLQVRDSLLRNGLRTGFAVLFYGAPGTGKTETVLQIAKNTSRDVIVVNVSDLKDAYVGGTEKNVKGVFDNYRRYVAEYGVFPILLFNEADAVLGTRMDNPRGAADRMENSMQNIILEEMEKLDGIMIATTNLHANLDKAFDRRFLYRICFTRPDITSMSKILHSMLPELSETEAETIALEYPMSGGQIENVCRRKTILSVILGRPATFEDIRRICSEEFSSETTMSKIGF